MYFQTKNSWASWEINRWTCQNRARSSFCQFHSLMILMVVLFLSHFPHQDEQRSQRGYNTEQIIFFHWNSKQISWVMSIYRWYFHICQKLVDCSWLPLLCYLKNMCVSRNLVQSPPMSSPAECSGDDVSLSFVIGIGITSGSKKPSDDKDHLRRNPIDRAIPSNRITIYESVGTLSHKMIILYSFSSSSHFHQRDDIIWDISLIRGRQSNSRSRWKWWRHRNLDDNDSRVFWMIKQRALAIGWLV